MWSEPHLSKSYFFCHLQSVWSDSPNYFTPCFICDITWDFICFASFFSYFFKYSLQEIRVSEWFHNWIMAGNLFWDNAKLRLEILLVSLSEVSKLNLWYLHWSAAHYSAYLNRTLRKPFVFQKIYAYCFVKS